MTKDERVLDAVEEELTSISTENDTTSDQTICHMKEKFLEVDGGAALLDDGLAARYCFRALSKYPILYCYKRYSYGTHHIRFRIEKRGEKRFFFGIITSVDKVCRIISTDIDNRSLYGWWGLNSAVINGKVQRNKEKNDIDKNDELTLILKCDHEQIELVHHRTERALKLSIDMVLCPFPWKIVVELPAYADCVRIIDQ